MTYRLLLYSFYKRKTEYTLYPPAILSSECTAYFCQHPFPSFYLFLSYFLPHFCNTRRLICAGYKTDAKKLFFKCFHDSFSFTFADIVGFDTGNMRNSIAQQKEKKLAFSIIFQIYVRFFSCKSNISGHKNMSA